MAFRNSMSPAAGPYLVNPSKIALLVAEITSLGASKSGSPALRLHISLPSAASFFALALISSVSEGSIVSARFDSNSSLICYKVIRNHF